MFSWIGYYYRANQKDYKKRKRDIENYAVINKETINTLGDLTNNMLYLREKKMLENKRLQFDNLSTSLHHLISTKTTPGVYNNPYVPEENKPQVFGANVEEHLKNNSKYLILGNQHLQKTFNTVTQGKVDLNSLKNKRTMKSKTKSSNSQLF